MHTLRPSPPWSSQHNLRNQHTKSQNPSPFPSPARNSRSVAARRSGEQSPAPTSSPSPSLRSPPPRQSLIYGPLTTTNVTTVVREESRSNRHAATPEKDTGPISTVQRGEGGTRSGRRSPSPQSRHATPTSEELRELRQTRSLFLCGRGLLSLRHIQHLSDMLSLRFLSVHMNAIKALEAGCLKTLRHLVELDLSANELQELPSGCWTGLDRLERLNLSSNLLTGLGPSTFKGLPALQWLSLGFNNLSDISGLSSVPAAAPLAYVDLCANRVATVGEVLQALAPHRADLQELRLAAPSPAPAASPTSVNDSAVSELANSFWLVQENPLCRSDDGNDHAAREEGGEPRGWSVGVGGAAPPAPPPAYVQQLLSFFPHLLVVNGVAYGVDPLEVLTPAPDLESQTVRVAQPATMADNGVLPTNDAVVDDRAGGKGESQLLDPNEAFARLLSQPLPRLPNASSFSSRTSSSQSTQRHTSRRASCRSTHHHRKHSRSSTSTTSRSRSRSRCQKHTQSVPAPQPLDLPATRKVTEQASSRITTATMGTDSDNQRPHAPSTPTAAHLTRHRSVPKPRRAALRRRSSSSSSAAAPAATLPASPPSSSSHSSSSTASPSTLVRPSQDHHTPLTSRPANAAQTELPTHARRLRYDGEDASGAPRASSPVAPPPTVSSSPTVREPPERDTAAKHQSGSLGGGDGGVGRSTKQSMPGLSPSGVTDASDASLSPVEGLGARPVTAACGSGDEAEAFSVDMSDSGTVQRSSDNDLDTAGHTEHVRSLHFQDTEESSGAGVARRKAALPTQQLRSSQIVRPLPSQQRSSVAHTAVLSHSPPATLQWRPKQISRGTSTDFAENSAEEVVRESAATAAAVDAVRSEMNARVEQLQEQLALRTTTIADLRRHLDLTRSQYVASQREAQQQQQQLRSQVSALKDELARRGEEAAIVQRKQQAQLNRAVDSVKAEWTRRLEAVEQNSAAAVAAEKGEWETQRARLREEAAQLQQTCNIKSAQVATLERQVGVMETEMAELRRRAVVQRQLSTAQARLFIAEAEGRRHVEAVAGDAFVACVTSFSQLRAALERETLQETLRQLHDARDAMAALRVAFETQKETYEAALQHAATEVQELRNQHSSTDTAVTAQPGQEPKDEETSKSGAALPPSPPAEAEAGAEAAAAATQDSAAAVSTVVRSGSAATAPSDPPLSFDPNDSVSAYWRDVCARAETQLRRLEAALAVATTTQQSLVSENTRLLHRVETLEAEQTKSHAAAQVAAQEKENLLRTLHTLRADMEQKDGALDALEAEARAKLNEKRHRIAELEEAVEALTTQQARAAEMNVSYRSQFETAQSQVTELQRTLDDERGRHSAAVQQQTAQVPAMEQKIRELSELLATHVAQAHQHELEKKTLVHALTTAREQLVRLQESNTFLSGSQAGAKEQLTRLQLELDAARQQLRDTQEATRAKQRATREALSHLMSADAL